MVPLLTYEIHDLDGNGAFSLDRAHGRTIRSVEAALWLTQEGMIEDIFLTPGKCYRIETKGRVVVAALGDRARFAVSPSVGNAMARLADRLRGFWRRSPSSLASLLSANRASK